MPTTHTDTKENQMTKYHVVLTVLMINEDGPCISSSDAELTFPTSQTPAEILTELLDELKTKHGDDVHPIFFALDPKS